MSTKTTFKRIALVAVAALGLGVLSVAPSQAVVSNLAIGVTNGSTTTANSYSDTSTAAVVDVAFLALTAADTVTVTAILKSAPATAVTTRLAKLTYMDTVTAIGTTGASSTVGVGVQGATGVTRWTTFVHPETSTGFTVIPSGAGAYAGGRFALSLDTRTATTSAGPAALVAGTYTYTIVATPYTTNPNTGVHGAGTPIIADASIVVSASTDASTTPYAAKEFAVMTTGAAQYSAGSDSATAGVTTAGTVAGYLVVGLRNSSDSTTAADTVTVTIAGAGLLCTSSNACGKSISSKNVTGDQTYTIVGDGTAGVGTISISTTVVTFPAKTVTFYASSAKTITASVNNPVLIVGSNTKAIKATAVDSSGVAWTGTLYIYAVTAADALVGGSATTPVACSYDATKSAHYCPITTIAAGTANFKIIDKSAISSATATSDAVAVKVSAERPATVKLAFDKATYAPFEKALITVTPLDAAGNILGAVTVSNLFATGGIASTYAFSSGSDTLTAVSLTTSADSSAGVRTAGAYTYTVYMPASGSVTISATGGSSLATAGQVSISASAAVVNSSVDAATDAANEATDAANAATDAALAAADAADAATAAAQDASDAVAALSASVEKLVASLKAQLTSLTNLVIKIQKKVKA